MKKSTNLKQNPRFFVLFKASNGNWQPSAINQVKSSSSELTGMQRARER